MTARFVLAVSLAVALINSPEKAFGDDFERVETTKVRPAQDKRMKPVKRIAILPFVGQSGSAASNGLLDTLRSQPNDYTFLERDQLNLATEELKLVEKGIVSQDQAKKIGEALGADAVIIGQLDVVSAFKIAERQETKMIKGPLGTKIPDPLHPDPVTIYTSSASLNLSIRMIHVQTGEILTQANEQGASRKVESENRPTDSDIEAFYADLVKEASGEFVRNASPHRVKYDVRLHRKAGGDEVGRIKDYLLAGRSDRATKIANENLELCRKSKDVNKIAAAIYNLAMVKEYQDSLSVALRYCDEAVDTLVDAGKDMPHTYRDASSRIRRSIDSEESLQQEAK